MFGIKGAAERLNGFGFEMADIIKMPFWFGFASYRLFNTLGFSYLAGVVLFSFCIWLDKKVNKLKDYIHKERAKIGEKLGNATTESFNHIKNLKFYNWDTYFENEIRSRKAEDIEMEKKVEKYNLLTEFLWCFIPDQMSSVSIALFLYMGNSLDLP